MTQKNKVKELVGRGLNSYHTKALQQMDRIEKKNKEQNHKISILSNELDNDYLTKTEEGSVISLEHSKEGMVYLDELQGNTLVNYCTDGSKEMTLNGDIDVEGVSVTTTEGVDNGKVDVMCEGNTLVNLRTKNNCDMAISDTSVYTETYKSNVRVAGTVASKPTWTYLNMGTLNMSRFKPSTTYTVIFNKTMNVTQVCLQRGNVNQVYSNNVKIQNNKAVLTTVSNLNEFSFTGSDYIYCYLNTSSFPLSFDCEIVGILEGDWTNKEVPSEYFEGMKSIGQDDENGHKIEILSRNKNLFDISKFKIGSYGEVNNGTITVKNPTVGNWDSAGTYEFIVPNYMKGKKLSLKSTTDGSGGIEIRQYDKNRKQIFVMVANTYTFDILNDCYSINLNFNSRSHGVTTTWSDIQLELSDLPTDYISHANNKKEILLNEPLRALPNGVKDRFVKIDGKWFIERNCGEKIFNGDISEQWSTFSQSVNVDVQGFSINVTPKALGNDAQYEQPSTLCDKFKVAHAHENTEHCYFYASNQSVFALVINKTKASDVKTLRTWLQNNNVKVVYVLATPTYEPLEVEPILNTYNDITHISNNSIIPCNMKIQNSGYNAIIKPSTLYTVALDTNKSGTVGMNLGGAKGTTTNNVLKLTTPATLTDDSLRLYGKGIKGSKVRLLEGDKTNWMPSHFEGMKSSFEDKLQSDGTYKMEILSNNKNLLDVGESLTFDTKTIMLDLKKGRYILDYKSVSGYQNGDKIVIAFYKGANKHITNQYLRKGKVIELTEDCDRIFLYSNDFNWNGSQEKFVTINTLQLSREEVIAGEPVIQKYNKIQFSSIEPLRGVGNIKDKFVFKDNKLMIQRNCKQIAIQNSDIDTLVISNNLCSDNYLTFYMENLLGRIENDRFSIKSNKFATRWTLDGNSKSICEGIFGEQIIGYSTRVYVSIDKKRLTSLDKQGVVKWLVDNKVYISYLLEEPTYEEVPFELQKIILEGYENGTLFFDTNIPPTSTVTYAGETPIVKATKLNKTEVLNNTNDINDNIIPYLMDMDYRVVCLQLQSENINDGISMARLFGGTYEMIKRDILSKRLTREEYGYRLADYYNAGKLTEEQVRELEDLR